MWLRHLSCGVKKVLETTSPHCLISPPWWKNGKRVSIVRGSGTGIEACLHLWDIQDQERSRRGKKEQHCSAAWGHEGDDGTPTKTYRRHDQTDHEEHKSKILYYVEKGETTRSPGITQTAFWCVLTKEKKMSDSKKKKEQSYF